MKTLKVKMPKLPKLTGNPGEVCGGLYSSIHSGVTNRDKLRSGLISPFIGSNLLNSVVFSEGDNDNEKPVTGAGRGGVHYGKTSAMGQIADSAVKTVRQKKKEIKPYKPIPQMHTFKSLQDMRRY